MTGLEYEQQESCWKSSKNEIGLEPVTLVDETKVSFDGDAESDGVF